MELNYIKWKINLKKFGGEKIKNLFNQQKVTKKPELIKTKRVQFVFLSNHNNFQ